VRSVYTKARNKYEAKIWGKFVDIPHLRLGPPRLAFGTPRGSRDPRLRTTALTGQSLRPNDFVIQYSLFAPEK